jgi:putative ABC transport system substrate-binding protein
LNKFNNIYYVTRIRIVFVVILVLINSNIFADNHNNNIVILINDNLPTTNKTISGIKRQVISEKPDSKFYQFLVSKDSLQNIALVDSVINHNPTLILTIGSTSTKFAQNNFKDIPVVFSSVKYPALSGFIKSELNPGSNSTGISIDIPVYLQFEKFKQVIPHLKTIGVLYTESTSDLITQAKILAHKMNIKLKALKVDNAKELPEKLDNLLTTVDGLWSVADHNLFHPISTKYILIRCLKNKVPVMGFSRHIVESGALFALDFDYFAVGLQAGRIVNQVLDGKQPSKIKVSTSDIINFHFNENTARLLNITIPDHLASIAKAVYR